MCQAQKSYERCIFKLPFSIEPLRLRKVSNFSGLREELCVKAGPGMHARATEGDSGE